MKKYLPLPVLLLIFLMCEACHAPQIPSPAADSLARFVESYAAFPKDCFGDDLAVASPGTCREAVFWTIAKLHGHKNRAPRQHFLVARKGHYNRRR